MNRNYNKIFLAFIIFVGCNSKEVTQLNEVVFDMETISVIGNYSSGPYQTNKSGDQSTEKAFGGEYSCLVTPKSRDGLRIPMNSVLPGDLVEISVWVFGKKNESAIILTSPGDFYKHSTESYEEKHGWYKMQLIVVIPNFNNPPILNVKLLGEHKAYYDNLRIKLIKRQTAEKIKGVEHIKIIIDQKELKKLNNNKQKALRKKILISKKDDWVNAKLKAENKNIDISLRLKGDWTDHLETDKNSFRIKVKSKDYKGNNVFSLQSPQTRGFMNEWVLHKLLEQEGILTTKYEFIYLTINDEFKGIYVKEDHFTNDMLESQGFQPSVMLKFDEGGLWKLRRDYPEEYTQHIYSYEPAEILPFEKKRTLSKNKKAFLEARKNLYRYQFEKQDAVHLFDIDKLAKYAAITDFTRTYHSLIWHNRRFYYNKEQLLEPVGYDGFMDYNPYLWLHKPFMGALNNGNIIDRTLYQELNTNEFRQRYLYYLMEYFNEKYFDNFFNEVEEEMDFAKSIINGEYPDYNYNNKFIYISDSIIKNELTNQNYDVLYSENNWRKLKSNIGTILSKKEISLVKNMSLKCYKNKLANKDSIAYSIMSFHAGPIAIIGFSSKNKTLEKFPNSIEAYSNRLSPQTKEIIIKKNYHFVHYKKENADSIHTVKIIDRVPPY